MKTAEVKEQVAQLPVFRSKATKEEKEVARLQQQEQHRQLQEQIPNLEQVQMNCFYCERSVKLIHMYRCLYCGVYYCRLCAQQHYGRRLEAFDEHAE